MNFLCFQASFGPQALLAAGWAVSVAVVEGHAVVGAVACISDMTCLTELGLEMSVLQLLQSSQSVVEAARYLSAGAVLFQLKL